MNRTQSINQDYVFIIFCILFFSYSLSSYILLSRMLVKKGWPLHRDVR